MKPMNIQETQHYVEVNGKERHVEITWDVIHCESISNCGDGEVTERWVEANPLTAIEILPDGNNGEVYYFIDKERSALAKALRKEICNGIIIYESNYH
jgi:hypothetical protein